MEYIPVKNTDNHNVSKQNPLITFSWLVLTTIVFISAFYLLLNFSANALVYFAPEKVEKILVPLVNLQASTDEKHGKSLAYVEKIVKSLSEKHEFFSDKELEVGIYDSGSANAFTLPGQRMLITSGLIEQTESEEEIAMVIGHELGHMVNRDTLKGFARKMSFLVISSFVLGSDNMDSVSRISEIAEFSFSREQERQADTIGLSLVQDVYGHCGGVTGFFEKMLDLELGEPVEFLSTHPNTEKRIERIKKMIEEIGCQIRPLTKIK